MEDFKKIEDLVDHVKQYVHVRVDETRLGLAERSSGVLSAVIVNAVLAGIFAMAFFFVFAAAALLLGRVLDDLVMGCLIVAAFLGLAGVIVWWGRQWLIRIPIMNAILDELFKNDHHEKD
jgi:putative superfamily III holin-X